MLRRLWAALAGPSLRHERGGQHAEAGVLIASLLLVGGAMVAAAPNVGEATANFWRCQLGHGGAGDAACGGDADAAPSTGTGVPRRSALEDDGVQPAVDASGSDPAAFHEPGVVTPDDQLTAGTWNLPGGQTRMSRCDKWTPTGYLCTAPDGTVWSCAKGASQLVGTCGSTNVETYPMTCSNEGTSPDTRLCRTKNGGIYHCTNTTQKDRLSCRATNNDSDAEMPDDATPVACGEDPLISEDESVEGSVTCIGSNGTLYQCPRAAAQFGDCKGGGRNINREDPSLSDCVAVPQYGEDAVQCTYTATERECPADATSCTLPQRRTSVLCHDDPPGTENGAYQHCQDLGVLADPKDKIEGVCLEPGAVDPQDGSDVCAASVPAVTGEGPPEGQGPETDAGDVSVSVPEDQLTEVTLPDGTTRSLTQDELTTWCEESPEACAAEVRRQGAAAADQVVDELRDAGLCSTAADCEEQLKGGATRGRRLPQDPQLRIAYLTNGGIALVGVATTIAVVGTTNLIDDITTRLTSAGAAIVVGGLALWGVLSLSDRARIAAGRAADARNNAGLLAGLAAGNAALDRVRELEQVVIDEHLNLNDVGARVRELEMVANDPAGP